MAGNRLGGECGPLISAPLGMQPRLRSPPLDKTGREGEKVARFPGPSWSLRPNQLVSR